MRIPALLISATIYATIALSCGGGVDDPLPCGDGDDPPPCGCGTGTETGSIPTISVPNLGFDRVRVRMIGPETYIFEFTLEGNSWSAASRSLVPGLYTLVVEGFLAGETTYLGSVAGVSVVACEALEPLTVPFSSFQPAGLSLTTVAPTITATWSAVARAEYYRVEHDSASAFLTPSTDSVSSTSHVLTATRTGWHYLRVRAGHSLVAQGRASEPDSVLVSSLTSRGP